MGGIDAASAEKQPLPAGVLAAAGLAVLDGALTLILLSLWTMAPGSAVSTVHSMGGLCLLLGVAPILLGGVLLDRNRKRSDGLPGVVWVRWSVLAGALLTSVNILIPMLAAFSAMTAPAA